MLKITVLEKPKAVTIKLDGRLGGPWATELDRTWQDLASSCASRKVSIDLRDMTYADSEGKRLLREIHQMSGATFVTNSPLSRYFAAQATGAESKESEARYGSNLR
jgi:hypothetical protein